MVNMNECFNHELVGCVHSLVAINIFLKSKVFFFLAKSPLNWLYNFVKLKKRVFFPIYPLAYCFRARLFLYLKKNNCFLF
jgi:hypothetical protein